MAVGRKLISPRRLVETPRDGRRTKGAIQWRAPAQLTVVTLTRVFVSDRTANVDALIHGCHLNR